MAQFEERLAKWEAVRKNAPQTKLTKTSLHSVYYVALALERQGDYPKAAEVYRSLILKNPEEAGTIFARLQAILARDYGNLPLRLALADLQMDAGKVAEALGQMDQALEVKKRLRDKPQGRSAEALLVVAYMNDAVARRAEEPQASLAAYLAARRELDMARRRFPHDAQLLMAEASLLSSRPEVNQPLAACAALSCLATPAAPPDSHQGSPATARS